MVVKARHGVDHDFHGLLGGQFALVTLRQTEINIQLGEIFQINHVRTIFDIVAYIDRAQTHRAAERRHDAHTLPAGTGERHLCLRHLQTGLAFINRALGDKALRHQILIALVVGLRNRHLGLRLLYLGALQTVVELHQHLPFAYLTAIGKA